MDTLPAFADPVIDAPALPEANPCMKCGGKCCSFKRMEISWASVNDADLSLSDEQAARATVKRGVPESLVLETGRVVDMNWYLRRDGRPAILFDCTHKTDDGKCGIYDNRPEMCRAFACGVLEGRHQVGEFVDYYGHDEEPDMSEFVDVTEAVVDQIVADTGADPPERFAE